MRILIFIFKFFQLAVIPAIGAYIFTIENDDWILILSTFLLWFNTLIFIYGAQVVKRILKEM